MMFSSCPFSATLFYPYTHITPLNGANQDHDRKRPGLYVKDDIKFCGFLCECVKVVVGAGSLHWMWVVQVRKIREMLL